MTNSRRAFVGRSTTVTGFLLANSLLCLSPLAYADAPNVFAVRGARIVPVSGPEIPRGTIVMRDGRIEALGADAQVTIPDDASIIAGEGLVVYPAIVDAASTAGLATPETPTGGAGAGLPPELRQRFGAPAADRSTTTGYGSTNGGVNAEVRAADLLRVGSGDWEARRQAGIGAALIIPRSGFFAGTSALALLSSDDASTALLRPEIAAHLNLGGGRFGGYPSSLMGAVALTRQTLLDARWSASTLAAYNANPATHTRPHLNRTSEVLAPVMAGIRPVVFQASSAVEIPMALKLAREFGLKTLIRGGSEASEVADALKTSNTDVLLGVNFPAKLTNPSNITRENAPTLQTLRRRANAPKNAGVLYAKGVRFALTSDGLNSISDFLPNVRKVVSAGLPAKAALEAMTLVPAQMLGVDRELGSLQVGKIANILVADGDLLGEKTRLRNVFIDGRPVIMPAVPAARPTPTPPTAPAVGTAPVAGATTTAPPAPKPTPTPTATPKPPEVGAGPIFPPAETVARTVLLRGGTVWTSGPQGILTDTDVLIRDGKIAAIGRGLAAGDALVIDARGKHITPGLIDCHSHTAILGGVNEGTNSVTAEVRIADVLNPEDIGIYRELAGGLTTANVLHGSANAIGGQNAVIKLRWGGGIDGPGLIYAPAPQGIKFALGENPTRQQGRYPNTRMGMEQVYRERFIAALDYDRKWADFRSGKSKDEPRRDLQLEAISEILSGKRLIHSHGYRQDEFLMLMRLCEEFNIKIRTFQHVLEGYKVADEMARAGIGGSTFSDWWAFKVEAQDAIPYNGALMAERGVLVSFNSDDGDLARRMNLEAAKAVKYGGLLPSEALKFVTINPAKQLGIDKTTGSLELGKDADVVLWSGDPLSVYSQCEETWVEGVRRFSRSFDIAQRAKVEAERKALLEFEGVKPKAEAATPKPVAATPAITVRSTQPVPYPRPNPAPQTGPIQAIVGGTVHTVSGATIPDGVVVMRGTQIVAVGTRAAIKIPRGAKIIQAKGMHISPGYIDAHTTLGLNEIESLPVTRDFRENGDYNPNVRAEIAVNPDSTLIPVARANGVLSAVTMPEGRLLAGSAALIRLQGWTWEDLTIRPGLGMSLNFPSVGEQGGGGRPGHEQHDLCESEGNQFDRDDGIYSLMGEAMAQAAAQVPVPGTPTTPVAPPIVAAPPLTTPQNPAPTDKSQPEGRQPATTEKREEAEKDPADDTALEPLNRYFDEAERYRKSVMASGTGKAPLSDKDVKFAAMLPVLEGREPLFVTASSATQIRAALSWAKRRSLKIVLYADGEGLMDAAPAIKAADIPVVLGPVLSYPERADEAYDINYTLPSRLRAAGIRFALSSGGDASNVRRLPDQAAMAACFGLPREAALRSITLDAAQILGVADRIGSLEMGKEATLIVTNGDPLEITSQVRMAWIAGAPVDLSDKQTKLYERYRARPRKP
ncbi:hypothetical protein EON83_29375 [bacterium]|nr:MAG: hypothetical protein EON83_29375 [bacterium]